MDTDLSDAAIVQRATPAFAVVPAWAIFSSRLTPTQFRVYTVLCLYANTDDIAWPKVETIGAKMGISHQAISKTTRELVKLGLITVTKYGFPARNRYHVYHGPQPPAAFLLPEESVSWLQLQPVVATTESDASCNLTLHQLQPVVASVATSEVADEHTNRTDHKNNDVDDDAHAREIFFINIISAGELPPQTNRAALAQLVANYPDLTESEWSFQAAAAEWYREHDRRLSLRNFGSWIERVARQKRVLAREEQEMTHDAAGESGATSVSLSRGPRDATRRTGGAGLSARTSTRRSHDPNDWVSTYRRRERGIYWIDPRGAEDEFTADGNLLHHAPYINGEPSAPPVACSGDGCAFCLVAAPWLDTEARHVG